MSGKLVRENDEVKQAYRFDSNGLLLSKYSRRIPSEKEAAEALNSWRIRQGDIVALGA
jgi:hypothetical protein